MHIAVNLYGDLRNYATHKNPYHWEGDIDPGGTVLDVIVAIGCPQSRVVRVLRNGLPITLTTDLKDGDVLFFISHLGGG